ncbi:alpha/beta fold hydrolase [Gordonia amicalis]|uniref:alpha/beta fold hydrolase n=1 Tax=Gordonia amicalis TaxID=89053 RepID=UPI0002A647F4|nr:alpha/beta hydrolase [Gordonia amicalis]MBA5846221.1 alpha/beta hydrolase [Gordonia amicalis]MDV7172745.1 alpha/beta hydrolase [Gordonia amicalis]NKX77114.1 alpha/beta hydrolase [Gordonia amicalis]UOG20492.1 alpha/beta hydrolase [Gordonia amicalis]GAC52078.1 putative hydrolase [Gordonia amicalis NBRC 100051 = JCM 11271]
MSEAPDPSSVRLPGDWEHLDVRANGVRFHAVEPAGLPTGDRPLILLLHGFGEFWWSWRHQLRALGAAGFRAVAVDLRGYGDTDKPPRGYDGWTLAGDTNGLVRALGHTSATLIGHSDGGLVCWATATLHPRVVDRIVVLASPHPRALRRRALRDRAQRSQFLKPFLRNQIPRLGERQVTRDDAAFIADYFAKRSSPAWRAEPDYAQTVELNRSAMLIPYVAHCSLEYRRWAFRSQFRPDGMRFMELMDQRLHLPVLALRGRDDPYILNDAMTDGHRWAAHQTYRQLEGSGHFVHQEQPAAVTEAILDFLRTKPEATNDVAAKKARRIRPARTSWYSPDRFAARIRRSRHAPDGR